MNFDVRTFSVHAGVVLLGFALTMAAVWASDRRRQNIGFAAAAYVCVGASDLFISLGEWIPELLSVGVASFVGCAGFLFLRRSIRIEFRSLPVLTEIALFLLVAAALLFYTTVCPDANGRTIVALTLMLVVSVLAIHGLLRAPRRALQAHHVLMLSAFAGFALITPVRIGITVMSSDIQGYMQASLFEAVVLLVWLLLFVVLGTGILWSSFADEDDHLKSRNRKLDAAKNAAQRAVKAKSVFLASLSHELRAPISAVLGITDLLLASQLTQGQRRQLTILKDSESSLLALVDDLLDLTKMEVGRLRFVPVPVELAAIISHVIEMLEPAANAKGINLCAELSTALPAWIKVDPLRLRQILVNLVHNAIKFTARGRVLVTAHRNNGQLRFEVSDTGVGIPADRQNLLFKEFSQVEQAGGPRHDGTGLGLIICKRLAQAMGGSIGVHSAPGAGSTFWFSINLIDAVAPAPVAESIPDNEKKKLKILVAEDCTANQLVIDAMLRREGHDVVMVSSGSAALDAVKQSAFDLILMDIEMREMDGVAASRAIRKLPPPIRSISIVALTAHVTPREKERCRRAGVDDFLVKPVDRAALRAAVAKWSAASIERPVPDPTWNVASSVLDFATLRTLEGLIGCSRLSDLVETFCRQLPNDVTIITMASERAAILHATHKLISASGYLGCVELTRAGREVIDAIADDAPSLAPFISRLTSAAHRTQRAMTVIDLDIARSSPVAPTFHAMPLSES